MALDALKNLVSKIPAWQSRLDDLGDQIGRRQVELAALGAARSRSVCFYKAHPESADGAECHRLTEKGLIHTGADHELAPSLCWHSHDAHTHSLATPISSWAMQAATSSGVASASLDAKALLRDEALKPSEVVGARADIGLTIQSRAFAGGKLQPGPTTAVTTRNRNMIIVYYDSNVQGFFDDLVRFVSSSRNSMRKVRMAAKVAQVKRMAEPEMQAAVDGGKMGRSDDGGTTGVESLPPLRYAFTRRRGPVPAMAQGLESAIGGGSGGTLDDIYNVLDKNLEFVQSTCEHGAHQFLREADCEEEIDKIRARMGEVLILAEEEIDRICRRAE